jgi:DNA-binding XRE family transcriptional regulator
MAKTANQPGEPSTEEGLALLRAFRKIKMPLTGGRSSSWRSGLQRRHVVRPRPAGALVARNIRRLRVARGFSQEMLAVDAGIDRTYVNRLERGLENPTVAVLEKLARAFSSNIEELFRVPRAGETAPRPLKGGRRAKQKEKSVL